MGCLIKMGWPSTQVQTLQVTERALVLCLLRKTQALIGVCVCVCVCVCVFVRAGLSGSLTSNEAIPRRG